MKKEYIPPILRSVEFMTESGFAQSFEPASPIRGLNSLSIEQFNEVDYSQTNFWGTPTDGNTSFFD